MSLLIFFLAVYVCGALSMALLTLLERKVLGYMQLRKGPNKNSMVGIMQPLADVIKLLSKESFLPTFASSIALWVSPVVGLFLSFVCFSLFPVHLPGLICSLTSMIFLCVSSVSVYPILMSGWSSNSKYALLGSVRAVAQSISYEVSMGTMLIGALIINEKMELSNMVNTGYLVFGFWLTVLVCWLISALAETGRAPFDFMEGESEIVSGFNIEYGGALLAFMLMAEYMNIILISSVTTIMFFGSEQVFLFAFLTFFLVFFLVWARGSLPRVRYDKLMGLTWKCFLPMSLSFLILSMVIT